MADRLLLSQERRGHAQSVGFAGIRERFGVFYTRAVEGIEGKAVRDYNKPVRHDTSFKKRAYFAAAAGGTRIRGGNSRVAYRRIYKSEILTKKAVSRQTREAFAAPPK
jgi:hypothetical protein